MLINSVSFLLQLITYEVLMNCHVCQHVDIAEFNFEEFMRYGIEIAASCFWQTNILVECDFIVLRRLM